MLSDWRQILSSKKHVLLLAITALLAVFCASVRAEWKPAEGPLATKWANLVSPDNALPEYPRPQMVRDQWRSLNGLWDYAIVEKDADTVDQFDSEILVPYPCESALSGVMKTVGPDKRLWYRRNVHIPGRWRGQRILLHFGAVDWDCTVWVNGEKVGSHKGGYDPFTFDITDALKRGSQEIVVSVWDPTNAGPQPRGKQVRKPGGIWYTAVTGIWQSVWIEPVPQASIEKLEIVPDIDDKLLRLSVHARGVNMETHLAEKYCVRAVASANGDEVATVSGHLGQELKLKIEKPRLWSPDEPFLYDLKVVLQQEDREIDAVESYFGMRKIALGADEDGLLRLMLNNKPLFQYGPLDQGWWPDGLYTAPTDEALAYDLRVIKELGCNMLRKHVKVEPARLYYWCDKLGLLVWQDMPNGNNNDDAAKKQFEIEWKRIIEAFKNHPSIVMWVPFNEGWGQYDTERIVELTEKWDPTRLVNNASGWTDKSVGDVHDVHRYPGPGMPPVSKTRAAVLGEFGGLGLPISGHTWQDEKNWGYRSYTSREALTDAYVALIENLRTLIGQGLAAAVYTQTTDVEIEVNGWMTYDRDIIKPDMNTTYNVNSKLYLPPPIVTQLVPTSQEKPIQWRYTTREPADGWELAKFDDSDWKKSPAGFGTKGTPGTLVRTVWNTPDIWVRRDFELEKADIENAYLLIHHDEDAQVYINGVLAAELEGYTTDYTRAPISKKALAALKKGKNTIAIHCKQTGGGQYIDAGIVSVTERLD